MLEGGCSNCKLQCLSLGWLGQKTVDKAAGERVTSANAVNYRKDIVSPGLIELLTVIIMAFQPL
jgi:hypothetical protein